MTKEADRIVAEYARRAREISAERYSGAAPSEVFLRQSRERAALRLLNREGALPLGERRMLAGVDLVPERVGRAQARLSGLRAEDGALLAEGADIRAADASELPWPEASFDIVLQRTVFSSILDSAVRAAVA